MALSVSIYNQTRTLFASGDINFSSLRVMLRDITTTFNSQHTIVNNLLGNEISGNGWDQGGELIPNVQVVSDDSDALLTADDVEVNAIGGSIGPAYSAVIIDEQDRLLLFIQFIEQKEAVAGTPFSFLWEDGNIIRWE